MKIIEIENCNKATTTSKYCPYFRHGGQFNDLCICCFKDPHVHARNFYNLFKSCPLKEKE